MSDLFYVFGIALTVMAVVVARSSACAWRASRRARSMIGGLALMTFLVVGSAA